MRSRIPATKNVCEGRLDFCVVNAISAHDYAISQFCANLLDFRKMGESCKS